MDCRQQINDKIAENWDEQMRTLRELIAIKSVAIEEDEEKIKKGAPPFGEGVDQAFQYVLDKGEEFGFETCDVDRYGGHVEFASDEVTAQGAPIMGIAAHLDCVPEGDGWTYPPFGCEINAGKIYGRGTNDDKGPLVASLFAMKAIKDIGLEPHDRVRLILGLDEETNWHGMDYYLENEESPDYGFTPDGDFPVINGEKGILTFDVVKKFPRQTGKGLELRSIRGGDAVNMVPSSVRAIVKSDKKSDYDEIREKAKYFEEMGKTQIVCRTIGKSLEISAEGITAHGAHPEAGKNAISAMMDFLSLLNFTNDGVMDFIKFYAEHIGYELDGASFGCRLEDDISGCTVFNAGMIEMDTKSVKLSVNIRYPIKYRGEQIYAGMDEICTKYDLGIVKRREQLPLFVDAGSDFITTLMSSYREATGDYDSEPLIIGGGTYARAFDGEFVAFGAKFPHGEAVEHQKDEYITEEDFRKMTEIFADAIYRCACAGE